MNVAMSGCKRIAYQALSVPAAPWRWYKNHQNDKQMVKCAAVFQNALEKLELIPAQVGNSDVTKKLDEVEKLLESMAKSTRGSVVQARCQLKRAALAQSYRHGIEDKCQDDVEEKLLEKAAAWKLRQDYNKNKELRACDKAKIAEVVRDYRGFSKFMLEDSKTREFFFRWVIVNDNKINPFTANDVGVFVKFPGLYARYLEDLASRSQRFRGNIFKVDADQLVTMPLEGKRVQFKENPDQVVLKGWKGQGKWTGNIDMFIRELIDKKITLGQGKVEIINEELGLCLYDSAIGATYHEDKVKIGGGEYYVKTRFYDNPNWLEEVPPMETLTQEELEDRFDVKIDFSIMNQPEYQGKYHGCPAGKYPLCFFASTALSEKDFDKTHSYFIFAIPREDGKWDIKADGQFAYPFPIGFIQTFLFLPRHVRSNRAKWDENMVVATRLHAAKLIAEPDGKVPPPEKFNKFVDRLAFDTQRGRKGLLPFNIGIKNCTTYGSEIVESSFGEGTLPDLRVSFWEMEPKGSPGKFYDLLKPLPNFLRTAIMALIFFLCGSWRSMTVAKKDGTLKKVSLLGKPSLFSGKMIAHPAGIFNWAKIGG